MHHIFRRDVVDERRAGELRRQVDARQVASDDAIGRRQLGRRGAARPSIERDGDRPIVAAGLLARAQEFSVLDRELFDRAAERIGEAIQEQRADLGADQANRGTADGDGIAAGGKTLGGADVGLAGDDVQLLRRDVELLGGDLRERGQDSLPDLDLAGENTDAASLLEADPLRQQRIVDQALRQRVRDHADALIMALARSTARMTRLWMPQRHRCGSSAVAISARLGTGLRASSAAADTRMPERQ